LSRIDVIEYDPLLQVFGFNRDLLYEVVGESISSGEPYILACRKCGDYEVCLFLQVSPLGDYSYRVLMHGLLVIVGHDKVLDKELEYVFRLSQTIRSVGGRVFLYIPRDISLRVYGFICGSSGAGEGFTFRVLPVEEALVYLD
jgi:hypothetical protein